MAKRTFKTIGDLNSFLAAQVEDVLKKDVAPVIKDVQSDNVESSVYSAYRPPTSDREPWIYERRGREKGLADTENMEHETDPTGNGIKLTVTNKTKSEDGSFEIAEMVEKGDGHGGEYDYKRNRSGDAEDYLRARPFLQDTADDLNSSKLHLSEMKSGLRRKGFDIKG